MENKEVRITVDMNGNVHREIIDPPKPDARKPRLLKRIAAVINYMSGGTLSH